MGQGGRGKVHNMDKKNFALEPRLVISSDRWYILYYLLDENTGVKERFRETYGLNRIKDLKARKKKANEIIKRLLTESREVTSTTTASKITLQEGLDLAYKIKTVTDRPATIRSYKWAYDIFNKFIEKEKVGKKPLEDFSKRLAMKTMDYVLIERKVGNRTYNGFLGHIKLFFNTLIEREYLEKNPFDKIKRKPKTTKKRRCFTETEAKVVVKHLYQSDYWLLLAIVLEYYCFIRPAEMRRLRFSDVHLHEGLIFISVENAKMRRERYVTIPKSILFYFFDKRFVQAPTNYLIFGQNFKPHPTTGCGNNTLSARHKRVLDKLKEDKLLDSTEGLSLYSWKDTGITHHAKAVSLMATKQQAGHEDINHTMIYYHNDRVNEDFRQLENNLLPTSCD
jgi:integrase